MTTGMTKLIFSDSWNDTLAAGMRIIEDPRVLEKSAATIFGCGYEGLKPDGEHIGIHVVALGDAEHYGQNRNADLFSKKACEKYHDTFVKHGAVYRHHNNKDRAKSIGTIVKSAYNEPMGRVELFIHAHKEKARDHLEKLASDGEVPVSMACRVTHDVCSICGTLRKNASDPNQCDHVRYELGKVYDDGRAVGTYNPEPKFFDISFVTRPADRIAWNLKTAGADIVSSVKAAELEQVWVPDTIMLASAEAMTKMSVLKRLAYFEDYYAGLIKSGSPRTAGDHYCLTLLKSVSVPAGDVVLTALRDFEPADVFSKLAEHGIVLDPVSFYKYALGQDYAEVEAHMPALYQRLQHYYSDLIKAGDCQRVCTESIFDVDATGIRSHSVDTRLERLMPTLSDSHSFLPARAEHRAVDAALSGTAVKIAVDTLSKISENDVSVLDVLAAKYAAYKLAAMTAMSKTTDEDAIFAQAVAQNLARTR